jgi:hypothetical protein
MAWLPETRRSSMNFTKTFRFGRLATAMAAGALTLIGANYVLGQDVRVNWSQNANFKSYKTFAWAPNLKPVNLLDQFVPGDVESALMSHGYVKQIIPNQPADLLVSYTFVTDKSDALEMTSSGFGWSVGSWGYYGGWGGWGPPVVVGGPVIGGPDTFVSSTESVPRLIGILSVDLIDAKTNKIIWRGQATEDNVAQTQSGDEKQIHSSVKKMFEHFPPKIH